MAATRRPPSAVAALPAPAASSGGTIPPGLGWSRADCQTYLDSRGFGDTPKSACIFCPFHSDQLWAEIKARDPAGWQDAVRLDQAARYGTCGQDEHGASFYLHRSLLPLSTVTLPEYRSDATDSGIGCSPFSCPGDEVAAA